MIHRSFSPILAALAFSFAASSAHAQLGSIGSHPAPDPNNTKSVAEVARDQRPAEVSAVAPAPSAHRGHRPGNVVVDPVYPPSPVRGTRGNVTIVIGNRGYPAYPSGYYGHPYGYPAYPYGSSVTIATPGFQNQNFTLFPWSTTVTTWGTRPGYPAYPTYYPPTVNYPAYPTYVPGPQVHGYRGAAGGGPYQYNGGAFIGGGYVPGPVGIPPLTSGYSRR